MTTLSPHVGRVLAPVRDLLDTLPASHVATQLESLCYRLVDVIHRFPDADRLRPPHLVQSDDGSVSLNWVLPHRRVALICETNPDDSSWHVVGDVDQGPGSLDDADLSALLALTLETP